MAIAFRSTQLTLLDIDPERLGIVGALAERMMRRAGWGGTLRLTGDKREAIEGADFVIVQLRVGGNKARYTDETLPLEFDCIGQETTGAGGFAKALRTVPVVLDLAELTQEIGAPGAWFVDFTNPTGLVTQALLDHGHRALGLCNVAIGFQREFAKHFGVEPERVQLEHVGLNHLTWERKVLVDGVDRLPELLADPPLEEGQDEFEGMPIEFIRELGAIPSYYLHYYYRTSAVLAHQRTGKTRAEEVMEIEAGLLELYKDPTLDTKPKLLEERGGAFYSDAAAALIASLHADTGDVQVVNVRNDGAIPNLAAGRHRRGHVHRRSRRRPSAAGGAAGAGDARARGARQGLREADRHGGDVGQPHRRAQGAHGEPVDPGLGHRAAAARFAPRGQPPVPAAVLPRRLT